MVEPPEGAPLTMTLEEAKAFMDNPPDIDGIESLVYVWNPVFELYVLELGI